LGSAKVQVYFIKPSGCIKYFSNFFILLVFQPFVPFIILFFNGLKTLFFLRGIDGCKIIKFINNAKFFLFFVENFTNEKKRASL